MFLQSFPGDMIISQIWEPWTTWHLVLLSSPVVCAHHPTRRAGLQSWGRALFSHLCSQAPWPLVYSLLVCSRTVSNCAIIHALFSCLLIKQIVIEFLEVFFLYNKIWICANWEGAGVESEKLKEGQNLLLWFPDISGTVSDPSLSWNWISLHSSFP